MRNQVLQADQQKQAANFAELQERVDQLEKELVEERKKFAEQHSALLGLREEVRMTADEVGKSSQLLLRQQDEWLKTVEKGTAFTPLLPSALSETGGGLGEDGTSGRVNLNTATKEQLDSLPGIGPSYADRIIAYRQEHGSFSKAEDLMEVTGIGESLFTKLKDLIEV